MSRLILAGLVAVSVAFGYQLSVFMDARYPSVDRYGTELTVAQGMTHRPVRLIGFDCDDHAAVTLAEYEDEFPERGCAVIRRLDDKEVFK